MSAGFLAALAIAATGVKMNYDSGVAKATQSGRVEAQIVRVLPKA